jgi:hypothetical protein
MTDDDLKQQIFELVESLGDRSRDTDREAIFGFVTKLLDERAVPVVLTPRDLEEIRSAAVSAAFEISVPCYLNGVPLEGPHRVTLSYVKAVNLFLRKHNLSRCLLSIDTFQFAAESVHED